MGLWLLAACSGPQGWADESPEVFHLPAIEAVKGLMQAEKWLEARVILDALQPRNEEEVIQRLFLLGLAETRLGQYRSAADRFESILARQPGLTRVRLELAQVYHTMGREAEARQHFTASLADPLPTTVKEAVETYLDRLDVRRRWSASLSLSVLPETNPTRKTHQRTVRIGGLPFTFEEDARAAPGTGWLINAGTRYSPMIGEGRQGLLAGSVAGKFYSKADWNEVSVQGKLGWVQRLGRGECAWGGLYHRRWLGQAHDHSGVGPWARVRWRMSSKSEWDGSLQATHETYRERTHRDGWNRQLAFGLRYAWNARTSIRTGVDWGDHDAQARADQYRLFGIAWSLSHAFSGGLSVTSRIAWHRRRHAGVDPLLQQTRSDQLVRFSVDLISRTLRFRGFAPYVGYHYEVNDSNLAVNAYVNQGMVFGITRHF